MFDRAPADCRLEVYVDGKISKKRPEELLEEYRSYRSRIEEAAGGKFRTGADLLLILQFPFIEALAWGLLADKSRKSKGGEENEGR